MTDSHGPRQERSEDKSILVLSNNEEKRQASQQIEWNVNLRFIGTHLNEKYEKQKEDLLNQWQTNYSNGLSKRTNKRPAIQSQTR